MPLLQGNPLSGCSDFQHYLCVHVGDLRDAFKARSRHRRSKKEIFSTRPARLGGTGKFMTVTDDVYLIRDAKVQMKILMNWDKCLRHVLCPASYYATLGRKRFLMAYF